VTLILIERKITIRRMNMRRISRGKYCAVFVLIIGVVNTAAGDDAEIKAHLDKARSFVTPYYADYDQAIAEVTEAIRLDPGNIEAYLFRGWVYTNRAFSRESAADYDRAIADYNEILRIDPDNADAYYLRGSAYSWRGGLSFNLKDEDRVRADYNEAIRLNPDYAEHIRKDIGDVRFLLFQGETYYNQGDYDLAITRFTEAINEQLISNVKDATPHTCRGRAYAAKGDYDHAIADYTEAIRIDPNYAQDAYAERSKAYEATGQTELMEADLEKYMEIFFKKRGGRF
jgi:tetratricopeptide (TPR) repeat protein